MSRQSQALESEEGLSEVSPKYLRRQAGHALKEIRFVLKKNRERLPGGMAEKLVSLEERLAAGIKTKDHEALGPAYLEAADFLEGDALPFRKSALREYAEVIILALSLALFARTFVIQAFKIPSGSMIPTLLVGDYLIVTKLSYGIKNPAGGWLVEWTAPRRGDIIVFITPEDERKDYFDQRDFIKRVIGVGGETVEFRDRQIYINGQRVEDPWGHYSTGQAFDRGDYGPVKVPEGHLFVMGDNRNDSLDSRVWGFVPLELVVGKAQVIYFSVGDGFAGVRWNRFGKFLE